MIRCQASTGAFFSPIVRHLSTKSSDRSQPFKHTVRIPQGVQSLLFDRIHRMALRLDWNTVSNHEKVVAWIKCINRYGLLEKLSLLKKGSLSHVCIEGIPVRSESYPVPFGDDRNRYNKEFAEKQLWVRGLIEAFDLEVVSESMEGLWLPEPTLSIFQQHGKPRLGETCADDFDAKFHTEKAEHPFPPNHLIVLGCGSCYYWDQPRIHVASADDIVARLSPEQQSILSKERFVIDPRASYLSSHWSIGGPILSWNSEYRPELRVDFNGTRPANQTQENWDALRRLEWIAKNVERVHTLSYDSCLVISNGRAIFHK